MVSNAASALGEAVGKLIEKSIVEGLREEVEARNHTIRPERLRNGSGNTYQIDAVIFDRENNPVIIIDPKYIRYTKHNRDKGSWLCVAHYNLRKTHPTIRKSIAVLAGRWSAPSKSLIRSFGIEILEASFEKIVEALAAYGIDFDWAERDRETPRLAWEIFDSLDMSRQKAIADNITENILHRLKADIAQVLETDVNLLPHRISEVEILLKTDQDEMLLLRFDTAAEALSAMAQFVADRPDIGGLLQPRGH